MVQAKQSGINIIKSNGMKYFITTSKIYWKPFLLKNPFLRQGNSVKSQNLRNDRLISHVIICISLYY